MYTQHKNNDAVDKCKSFLRSLRRNTKYESYELIFVDNGSKAKKQKAFSQKLVKEGVIVVTHDRPLEINESLEKALLITEGNYVFLMTGDTYVPEYWLSKALQYFASNNEEEIHCKYGDRIVNGFRKTYDTSKKEVTEKEAV